jgi:hypothetical protein
MYYFLGEFLIHGWKCFTNYYLEVQQIYSFYMCSKKTNCSVFCTSNFLVVFKDIHLTAKVSWFYKPGKKKTNIVTVTKSTFAVDLDRKKDFYVATFYNLCEDISHSKSIISFLFWSW